MLYRTNADALLDVAPAHLRGRSNPAVLDLGCGCGELLSALSDALQGKVALHGLDESAELLRRGRERYPHIQFIEGDLRDAHERVDGRKFDVVFMTGTHSIFDDVDSWLRAVVSVTAAGGAAYVLGLFNPEKFDTIIKWRKSEGRDWLAGGYNCWSIQTVAATLARLDCGFDFQKVLFDTSFIDTLDPSYPMTFRRATLEDGSVHLVNGLQLLCNNYLLTIRPSLRSAQLSLRESVVARLRRRLRYLLRSRAS